MNIHIYTRAVARTKNTRLSNGRKRDKAKRHCTNVCALNLQFTVKPVNLIVLFENPLCKSLTCSSTRFPVYHTHMRPKPDASCCIVKIKCLAFLICAPFNMIPCIGAANEIPQMISHAIRYIARIYNEFFFRWLLSLFHACVSMCLYNMLILLFIYSSNQQRIMQSPSHYITNLNPMGNNTFQQWKFVATVYLARFFCVDFLCNF